MLLLSILPKMSAQKYALILVPIVLFVWKPSSLFSISASNLYQNIIIGFGALNQFTYVPALLISTLFLLLVFVVFLNLSFSTYIDQCILYYYTSVTRKIHLPKNRTPKQFTPSISFMGGEYYEPFLIRQDSRQSHQSRFQAANCGCLHLVLVTTFSKILISAP